MGFGLSKAESSGKGNPLPDSECSTKIEKCFLKKSVNKKAKTQGDTILIVEFTVTEIGYQRETESYKKGSRVKPVAVGEKRSWSANFKHDSVPARVREFLFAVTGAKTVDEGKETFEALCKAHKVSGGDQKKTLAEADGDYWDAVLGIAVSAVNPFAGLDADVAVNWSTGEEGFNYPVYEWRESADTAEAA